MEIWIAVNSVAIVLTFALNIFLHKVNHGIWAEQLAANELTLKQITSLKKGR